VTAISSDARELEPKAAEAELCKIGCQRPTHSHTGLRLAPWHATHGKTKDKRGGPTYQCTAWGVCCAGQEVRSSAGTGRGEVEDAHGACRQGGSPRSLSHTETLHQRATHASNASQWGGPGPHGSESRTRAPQLTIRRALERNPPWCSYGAARKCATLQPLEGRRKTVPARGECATHGHRPGEKIVVEASAGGGWGGVEHTRWHNTASWADRGPNKTHSTVHYRHTHVRAVLPAKCTLSCEPVR
jgi:hypothetical protein